MIAAAALAITAPAAAQQPQPQTRSNEVVQPTAPVDPRDAEMLRNMPSPTEMKEMGEIAARGMEAMMDVPIGPLREAVEGRKLSPRERKETLGDHARRDDPNFKERMRDQIGLATVALGALAEQMTVMGPVLRRSLEDVSRRMEDAARAAPQRPSERK